MKAAFISDVSPSRGHIYGLRFSSFARGLARRGHEIVLLSPTHAPIDTPVSVSDLPQRLAEHDWSQPLFITVEPRYTRLVEMSRDEGTLGLLRRSVTAYLLAAEGGVHGDWERGTRPLVCALANDFRPDIVWAVFGNASTLVVAQRLAALADAAWLPDIKDNWESYTPSAIRPIMRWRFSDASGFTTNAELHGTIAERWLEKKGHVLYSGVADAMAAPADARARNDVFLLALVGSTYRPDMLARFLGAFGSWLDSLSGEDRAHVHLRYCGSSRQMVEDALARTPLACAVEVTGNIPHDELARTCQGAMANCYLWAPFTFHHKMLELLSTRRPAISFPGEHGESVRLARSVGGELLACQSETELVTAFDTMWRRWKSGDIGGTPVDVSAYSWDAGAAKLEKIFEAAIANYK